MEKHLKITFQASCWSVFHHLYVFRSKMMNSTPPKFNPDTKNSGLEKVVISFKYDQFWYL